MVGDIKKVASCKVKPYELIDHDSVNCKCKNTSEKVILDYGLEDVEAIIDETRLKQREEMKQADVASDTIGTHYLKVENSANFSDLAIYTVELPVSEHGKPEVKEAKKTEVQNLLNCDVFKEVENEGQYTLGSRWVVTAKEKHDRQNKNNKARLVFWGFQETVKPTSDSPTV